MYEGWNKSFLEIDFFFFLRFSWTWTLYLESMELWYTVIKIYIIIIKLQSLIKETIKSKVDMLIDGLRYH